MLMLVVELLSWWYGEGWRELALRLRGRLRSVIVTFSVATLVRTLFEPWRRIVSSGEQSLAAGLRASLDNAVSRFVGFNVRIIVIITATFMLVLLGILGVVALIAWPILPLAGLGLVIKGLL